MEAFWRLWFDIGLRFTVKPIMKTSLLNYKTKRWLLEVLALSNPSSKKVKIENLDIASCVVKKITAQKQSQQQIENPSAILYAHGGAFVLCSFKTHGALASYLSELSGADVYFPEYTLAPEAVFPQQINELQACYEHILAQGVKPENISLIGDSAGASLVTSLIFNLQKQSLPMPKLLVLISPWLDIACSDSQHVADNKDRMLSWKTLRNSAKAYVGKEDVNHPAISTINLNEQQLSKFPKTVVHVGSNEIVLPQAQKFHQALQAVSIDSQIKVFPGMWHDFQLHTSLLEESRASMQEISEFVRF